MCVTTERAKLSDTVLYAGEAMLDGRYVHVIGYENKAQNLFSGPNAMILPFPAKAPMGPANVIDTTEARHILKDLSAVVPRADIRSKGFGRDLTLGSRLNSVQVFDSGSYTIVMSKDASAIPDALPRVPTNKRPRVNQEIFDAYAKWYPHWSIALCCFEAGSEVKPEPMLWWYEPINEEWLFVPGVDSHNGRVPNLQKGVDVFADLVMGSTLEPAGTAVRYREVLRGSLAACLPVRAIGTEVRGLRPNGDYLIQREMVRKGNAVFKRMAPPGAF